MLECCPHFCVTIVVSLSELGLGCNILKIHIQKSHYTTTPRLAMDDLTAKAVTGADDLTLKTYSERLLLPV
jgi:hypothetical protein